MCSPTEAGSTRAAMRQEWAQELEFRRGEIVLNSIDTDGVRQGYSIDLTRQVAEAVRIPVIASVSRFHGTLLRSPDSGRGRCLAASVFHFE